MSAEKFSMILREAMEAHDLDSAKSLADIVGMDASNFSEYLSDKRVPSKASLRRIAAALPGFEDRLRASWDRFRFGVAARETQALLTAFGALAESAATAIHTRRPDDAAAVAQAAEALRHAGANADLEAQALKLRDAVRAARAPATASGPPDDPAEIPRLRAVLKQALDKLKNRDDRVQLAGAYRAANGTQLTDADFGIGPQDEVAAESELSRRVTGEMLQLLRKAGAEDVDVDDLLLSWRGALNVMVAQKKRRRAGAAGETPTTGHDAG